MTDRRPEVTAQKRFLENRESLASLDLKRRFEYIFESNARDVRLNLPGRFYRQLPALADGPCRGLPRIYGLARELVSRTDLPGKPTLADDVEVYSGHGPKTMIGQERRTNPFLTGKR